MRTFLMTVLASLFLNVSVAFAQPSPTPAPSAIMPDAEGITAFCATIPQVPTGRSRAAATTAYRVPLVNAQGAFGQLRHTEAAPLFWEALTIVARDAHPSSRAIFPEIGERLLLSLGALGEGTLPQRCALLQCLVEYAPSDQVRVPFEGQVRVLGCDNVVPPREPDPSDAGTPPPTVDASVSPPPDAGTPPPPPDGGISIPPPPPVASRSTLNWVAHVSGWLVGAGGLGAFGALGTLCEDANDIARRANSGQRDGWDRAAHAEAQNMCLGANIALGVGVAAIAVTTTSFFLTRPSRAVSSPPRIGFFPVFGPVTGANVVVRF